MDLREVQLETHLTKMLFSKAAAKKIPLSGTFELSPVCNFSCEMCYVRKTKQEVEQHSRPILKKEEWIRIAKEARKQGMLYLLLTGGEPFLWPDFWGLYEELTKMGFIISINTNGSLINKDVVKRLVKNPPSRINITLYGANDETYESLCGVKGVFDKVDWAISSLKKEGVEVKLNVSLTPHNAHDMEQLIQYAQEKELIMVVNTYMFPPIRRNAESIGKNERFTPQEAAEYNLKRYRMQYGDEIYYQFLEKVKQGSIPPPGLDDTCIDPIDGRVRCRAGKASFWITWDGWITPCGMMTAPKVNIIEKDFTDAWKELVEISGKISLSGICTKCPNQELCHACAAMALAETGSAQGVPSYLCQMVEALRKRAEENI